MSGVFTGAFWKAASERALKTAAQSALLFIGGDAINAFDLDWPKIAGFVAAGAISSYLTSLASTGFGNVGPSMANEVLSPPAAPIPDDLDLPGRHAADEDEPLT